MNIKLKKAETLTAQIELTRNKRKSWPDWMRSIAYFSSTDVSQSVIKSDATMKVSKKASKQ